MEGVIVQRINDVLDSCRRIDADHGIVDRIGNRGVESPVPVWNSEQSRGCLVLGLLRCWIGACNLLGIGP